MCKNFNSRKHQSSFFVKLAMLAFVFSFSFSIDANAQGFLKGLADRAKEKIKEKVTDKVERTVENATDRMLEGKVSDKKSKANNDNEEEITTYSNDGSSYDDETNNSASNESSEIESVDLTSWVEMAEIGEKDVHQYALAPKACVNKIFEGFEDKLTADNIEIVSGTLNGKDGIYIYTYNGTGSAKVYTNYDENLNVMPRE